MLFNIQFYYACSLKQYIMDAVIILLLLTYMPGSKHFNVKLTFVITVMCVEEIHMHLTCIAIPIKCSVE